jgi:D-serine deaminase-like pyridoxal phosphate-dependent protein
VSSLEALETPCLLLDRARLEANCRRMREAVRCHGVTLRPHLKTAKSLDVAKAAFGGSDARGVTVSTLDEAAYFVERGLGDQIYAVGIVPDKLARVAELQRSGATVAVITDDVDAARRIAPIAWVLGARFDVFVEIDSGQHRGGLAPDDPRLIELATILDVSDGVRLRGVLTHGGHSYQCRSIDAVAAVAEQERSSAVEAAERIRAAGIACPEVSVGSTPTALHARSLDGVTEVRAGVYVFFDLFQHAIGSCERDDLALSVLASVVSRREDAMWIDAGTLALSSERSLDAVGGSGFGEVTAADGTPLPGAPKVVGLNQEHGEVVATDGALDTAPFPIGSRVRVWPNHACITAAMFDRYHVVEETDVAGEWPRLRG